MFLGPINFLRGGEQSVLQLSQTYVRSTWLQWSSHIFFANTQFLDPAYKSRKSWSLDNQTKVLDFRLLGNFYPLAPRLHRRKKLLRTVYVKETKKSSLQMNQLQKQRFLLKGKVKYKNCGHRIKMVSFQSKDHLVMSYIPVNLRAYKIQIANSSAYTFNVVLN